MFTSAMIACAAGNALPPNRQKPTRLPFTSSGNKANLGSYELDANRGDIWLDSNDPFKQPQSRTRTLPRNTTIYSCLCASAFLHHLPFPRSFTSSQPSYAARNLQQVRAPGMAAEKRTIGMGMDYSPSGKAAARWAVDNLLKAGDRLVLVHVLPKGAGASHKELWKSTGSPLIPLSEFMEMNLQARYGLNPDKEILEILRAVSKSKQVEVLAKIYWGDAREKLCEAVDDLNVDSFVLGCRGLGPLKRALLGSVSNYVVNNATCPVTVVRGPTGSSA